MTLAERLAEAEAALHDLMTGNKPVSLTDQNGEKVDFQPGSRAALQAYIGDLKRQIAGTSQPTTIKFNVSKGT